MRKRRVIHSDPGTLGGTTVFVGTRVPVQALIDYLGAGRPVNIRSTRWEEDSEERKVGGGSRA